MTKNNEGGGESCISKAKETGFKNQYDSVT